MTVGSILQEIAAQETRQRFGTTTHCTYHKYTGEVVECLPEVVYTLAVGLKSTFLVAWITWPEAEIIIPLHNERIGPGRRG